MESSLHLHLGYIHSVTGPEALAGNLGTLLAFRFLTEFFGSPAPAMLVKYAYAISIWGISTIYGLVLGLLVKGFTAQAKDGDGLSRN
ncbi:hypothetical protein GB937_007186 [Aspergillus fischeri]|nr:hypothetical protein GB937_007186 [Aspergillus fischeri]